MIQKLIKPVYLNALIIILLISCRTYTISTIAIKPKFDSLGRFSPDFPFYRNKTKIKRGEYEFTQMLMCLDSNCCNKDSARYLYKVNLDRNGFISSVYNKNLKIQSKGVWDVLHYNIGSIDKNYESIKMITIENVKIVGKYNKYILKKAQKVYRDFTFKVNGDSVLTYEVIYADIDTVPIYLLTHKKLKNSYVMYSTKGYRHQTILGSNKNYFCPIDFSVLYPENLLLINANKTLDTAHFH